MEIYSSAKEISERIPAVVALGFFDGLHLGHIELISKSVEYAKEYGLSADVFTFRDHPKNIMSGEMLIPRLMSETEKLERLSALGIDRVFDFDFSDIFHSMPPEAFAQNLLIEAFSAKAVFCGFNYRFGANASGNPEILTAFGKEYGFETHVIDPVYVSDRLVSSSLIRRCINSGDIEPATRLLGRDYALKGVVTQGRGLGHIFGFPTANFFPDHDMTLPSFGVYVTETLMNGACYPSVSNVGVNPTVDSKGNTRVETHILDRKLDLYGKEISVCFQKMLRRERRFESEKALKHQISSDVDTARRYFHIVS